jgi:hypothetical protein
MSKETSNSIQSLQIKILLDDTKPPVWRRVLIPNNMTLHDLHLVIQASFNWYNCHLYGFDLPERKQAVDIEGQNWQEWGIESYHIDSRKALVTDYLSDKSKYIHYDYDFGDGWRHTVGLEKIVDKVIDKPELIKAKTYAPVEDSGSTWGWYNKLAVLKNYPSKPTADDKLILEWMADMIPELDPKKPKEFDPTIIDVEEIKENVASYQNLENTL